MRRITQTPLALALLGLPIQAQTTTFNLADIDDPFGSNTQEFGRSLDVSGPFGVVGSDDGAWLLERQDSGLWTLGPELTPFDGNSNIGFGRAVAMDGERLAIGAPTDSGSGVETGSVYLFNRFGDQWFPGAKLFLPSALDQVEFAASLALDGDRLVVGSPRAKSPFNNARTGLVHVFDRQPDGNWALDATLAVQSGADDLRFGHAVALDGDRLVVGAPYEDLVFKAGTAFVFERGSDGSWKLIRELTPMGTQINDAYGTAVALVDEEIAVGAPRYDGATLDSGAVVMWGLAGNLWKEGALLEAPSILFG
ncbi:MAG: FG-GAP repeat protein, partial [Planctomycetota bacterium]